MQGEAGDSIPKRRQPDEGQAVRRSMAAEGVSREKEDPGDERRGRLACSLRPSCCVEETMEWGWGRRGPERRPCGSD